MPPTPTEFHVDGRATLMARPDSYLVTLRLSVMRPTQADAIRQLDAAVVDLVTAVSASGVASRLLTVDRRIEPQWEDPHQTEQRGFMAFAATQALEGRLDQDRAQLGRLMEAVAGTGLRPELRIGFTLGNDAAVRERARRGALANARYIARSMAEALGLVLGPPLRIQHTPGAVPQPSALVLDMGQAGNANVWMIPQVEPPDVPITEVVSGIWSALPPGA